MRFKLLSGVHVQDGIKYVAADSARNILTSDYNLAKRYPRRFQRLPDDESGATPAPVTPPVTPVASNTVVQEVVQADVAEESSAS